MFKLIYKLTHRKFKNATDYFIQRTRHSEFNELVKFQAISSDGHEYTLPFCANPFRAKQEQSSWLHERGGLEYEYDEEAGRKEALGHFEIAYDLIKDRVPTDATLLDVGCSGGFFLQRWHERGYTNLYGIDPQHESIEHAKKTRPYLNVTKGFFGKKEFDIQCDLMVFFQSIFRVPYQDRLFDAIDRCARKYVLISWVEDSSNIFNRDLHIGMAKKGFMCIEKKVFSPDLKPYGTKDADGVMIKKNAADEYFPNFVCHYFFRRIDPEQS